MNRIAIISRLVTLFCWAQILGAQSSLASRVLVVYASNDPSSSIVASYYQSRRGIPAGNMCPITLPDINALGLNASVYNDSVKIPVQNCLTAAGRENILYIVLAYLRPYGVDPGAGLSNYALDSYLEDIWDQYTTQAFNPWPTKNHPYYADNQSQGNAYSSFQSLAKYRDLGTLPLIYSVWRLDGVTPELAEALVDNALVAEAAGGPVSPIQPPNACIDMTVDPTAFPDTGYRAADWDLFRASQFLSVTGNFNVVADTNGSVFGTAPSPTCPNTALYAGWYNYGTYNDAFSWVPGAIGWDLDSGALADPRGSVWWGTNALRRGLTVTSGPMAEPYLEGIARPSGVIRNLLEGADIGDAFLRNTRWLKWRIVNVGDPLYTPFANGLAPFNFPVRDNSLSLSPRELVGGGSVAVTITVAAPAPADGLAINLSSNNPALSVPTAITIPAGASTANFIASTGAVSGSTDTILTASAPSLNWSNTVTIDPLLSGVGFERNTVQGGQSVKATIFLNASAPINGVTVQLSSDQPNIAAIPPSVTISGGLSKADFTVSTFLVDSNTIVNITSSYAGATPVAQLTVTP